MRGLPSILMVTLLTGCAAPPGGATDPRDGFGAGATTFVDAVVGADDRSAASAPAPVGPAVADASDPVRELERELRADLAGADPVPAALDLAALLCDLERHAEALPVLEQARARARDPMLTAALASVHRDLGARHRAVGELRILRREQGAVALHPGLLFELAELEWLEGDRGAAGATLAELRAAHADHGWCSEHADDLAALGREIEHERLPQRIKLRDLLGNLRGAPSPYVRLQTLEELARIVTAADADAATRALLRRVVAIGCADESAAVRARAIRLGPPPGDDGAAFCRAALADVDPFVRGVAAARTCELLGSASAGLLLEAMEAEADPGAFAAMHAAIAAVAGRDPAPVLDPADAGARAAAVAAWRQRWGR